MIPETLVVEARNINAAYDEVGPGWLCLTRDGRYYMFERISTSETV